MRKAEAILLMQSCRDVNVRDRAFVCRPGPADFDLLVPQNVALAGQDDAVRRPAAVDGLLGCAVTAKHLLHTADDSGPPLTHVRLYEDSIYAAQLKVGDAPAAWSDREQDQRSFSTRPLEEARRVSVGPVDDEENVILPPVGMSPLGNRYDRTRTAWSGVPRFKAVHVFTNLSTLIEPFSACDAESTLPQYVGVPAARKKVVQ